MHTACRMYRYLGDPPELIKFYAVGFIVVRRNGLQGQ